MSLRFEQNLKDICREMAMSALKERSQYQSYKKRTKKKTNRLQTSKNSKKQEKKKKRNLCWQNPHTDPTFLPPSSSLFSPSIFALISLSFSITRSEHMHATNTRKHTHTGDKEALEIGRLADGAFTMGDVKLSSLKRPHDFSFFFVSVVVVR